MTQRSLPPTWSRDGGNDAYHLGLVIGAIMPLVTVIAVIVIAMFQSDWYSLALLPWLFSALAVGWVDRRWRWVLAAALAPAPPWVLLMAVRYLADVPDLWDASIAEFFVMSLALPLAGAVGAAAGVSRGRRATQIAASHR